MGRPKKSAGGGADVAAAEKPSREKAQKSYVEESEEEEEAVDPKDKDFSEDDDVSAEDSGSEWGGESSGSEYGKKKKKVSIKGKGGGRGRKASTTPKGKGAGRGRGRPPAKNGKAAPAKRGRKNESEDESDEEGNTSGSEYGKKKASPTKKKASPVKAKASPKPRGRKPAAKRAATPDDDDEEEEEEERKGASSRRGGRATKASKSYKEVSEDEIAEVSEEEKPVTKRAKLEPKKKPAAEKEKKKESEEEEDEDESMEEDEKVDEKKNGTTDEKKEEVKKDDKKPKAKAGKNGNGKAHSESEEDDEEEVEEEEEYGSAHSDEATNEEEEEDAPAEVELKNQVSTDYSKIDFESSKKSAGGDSFNFKIAMWNIGGIKSWIKKNGVDYLTHEDPDIMCFNEVKCNDKTKPEEDIKKIEKYPHKYWSFNKEKSGHSGVAIFSKVEPKSVQIGFPETDSDPVSDKKGKKNFSDEGRLITLEYENFYLITVYVPNSGKSEKSDDYPKGYPIKVQSGERQDFDRYLREYIKDLDKKKPVILSGDLNCAHKEIDLKNAKTNERNAGFTEVERDDFSKLLEETKLIDTFRTLYPDEKDAYSFWSYKFNSRQKNVGWRLDYFLLSEKLKDSLCDIAMRKDVYGSDHCPIVLFIKN